MTAAAIADDARDGGGTTSGTKEVERRREQPPRATPGAVAERSFGVVPQLSPIVTAGRWQPLLNEVSRQTSVSLRFATASGITRFEERVLAGKYDFVYLNSLLFQEAQKSRGYRALVRDEQSLRGIIVVRQDGPQALAELGGKTLAVYTGAHGDANGLDQLLDAAEQFRNRPDIAIVLLGEGKMKETLKQQAATKGLTNFHLIDPVPKTQLPGILAACHIG
ncbi:MAG: PhnD/SsuA/transferrin family substrate-binding protein, partial [Pseudomonadota bacterium]